MAMRLEGPTPKPRRKRPGSNDLGGTGVCRRCGAPKPKGRAVYCGDECYQSVHAEREDIRKAKRATACKRCGGVKELGVRGGKFCAECRRLMADASSQFEYERGRRRNIAIREAALAAGQRVPRRNDAPDGMKWCARCQDFAPITSFPFREPGGKPASYCRPCQRSYNRERRVNIQFGLTWDEYELILATQDDSCAICGGRPRRNALAVDHDHKTGEIRGLLCSRCNHKLLGSANDDPARLRKAADYLEEFGPREVFGEPRYIPGYPNEAAS